MDYWREDNQDAYFPRARFNAGNTVNENQTRYLQDASYIRLKQVTLGYAVPFKYIEKLNITKLRLYFAANNLWEASKMKKYAFDPEMSSVVGYPLYRSFSFGATITF